MSKEKRDRLFKKSRPFIRPLEPKDMGWLWAAYKVGSFKFPDGMTQEDFTAEIQIALRGASHFMVEDDNRKFQSGRGPVAMIGVATDGQKLEPAAAVFKWATPRNVLRGFVAFFQWARSSKDGGKYEVRMPAKDKLFKRLVDYGVVAPLRVEIIYGAKARK